MKVLGLVGNVRNAERQKRAGVDYVIAQGHEAGGHTGKIANFPLIPMVVDAVKPVPVIAAGAIADGRTMLAGLALGAVGVWVGTAFLLAEESRLYPGTRRRSSPAPRRISSSPAPIPARRRATTATR